MPTKSHEQMDRPCLGVVDQESNMEWRRAPWIEVDMQDTMNLSYTWKGWPIVEGAVGGHF